MSAKKTEVKVFNFNPAQNQDKIAEKLEKQKTDAKANETPLTAVKAGFIDNYLKIWGSDIIDSMICLFRRIRISPLVKETGKVSKPLAANFQVEEDKRLKAISPGFTVDTFLVREADYYAKVQGKIDTMVEEIAKELNKSVDDLKLTWNDFAAAPQFQKRCMDIWSSVTEDEFGIKGPHVKKVVLRPGLWAGINGKLALRKYKFYMASTTRALTLIGEGKLPGQVKWGYGNVITDAQVVATANYIPLIYLTYNSDYKMGKKSQTDVYKEIADTIAVYVKWFLAANNQKLEPGQDIDKILTRLTDCSKSFKATISKVIPTQKSKNSNSYVPNY